MVKNSLDHGTHTGTQDGWSTLCVGSGNGSHRVRQMGYVRGPRQDGLNCDRPVQFVCLNAGCKFRPISTCKSLRGSKCGPCSTRQSLKIRRIATDGLQRRCATGYEYLVTVTAPGEAEHLQWVIGWDGKTPRPVCGCERHLEDGLGRWNASASKRWNRLRGALKRRHPEMAYWRGVEVQDGKRCKKGCEGRGAIHYHSLIWSADPLDSQEVQSLAMRAGFGCVMDVQLMKRGDTRAAAYASKYVSKSTDQRGQVPWETLDVRTGELAEVKDAPYRVWSCSRDWGLTMKVIDEAIRDAARKRAALLRESAEENGALASAGIGGPVIAGCDPP